MTSSVPEHDQWAYHPKPRPEELYGIAPWKTAMTFEDDMQAIVRSIGQSRIDGIAKLIRGLTYGHMIALSAELASHGEITQDTLPKVLWAWSTAAAKEA